MQAEGLKVQIIDGRAYFSPATNTIGIDTAVSIAAEVTKRIGAKLVVAGQGAQVQDDMLLGEDVMIQGDHIEHFGFADFRQRAELLSHAKATFMPTTYLEPIGGVSVESLLCGTPVIATDFGAFREYYNVINPGVNTKIKHEFIEVVIS